VEIFLTPLHGRVHNQISVWMIDFGCAHVLRIAVVYQDACCAVGHNRINAFINFFS